MTLTSETKNNKKALAFLFKLNHCALPRRRREENHLSLWEGVEESARRQPTEVGSKASST